MAGTSENAGRKLEPKVFGLLFAVSVIVAIGNTGMQSILPAIGRKLQIPDALVAAIFSLSALLWAVMSPIWARQSDIRGRKPLILLGLAGFAISMTLCGLVVTAGLHRLAGPMIIFVMFLLARATFGLIGSASNPATQAYVAERTSREERTQQMATLAGAFGLGTIVGPAIAPMFVKFPIIENAGPMFVFAAAATVILVLVWRFLPETYVPREQRRFSGAGQAKALWKDPRLVPFLVFGFLVATCQSGQQQILGFMLLDLTSSGLVNPTKEMMEEAIRRGQDYTAVAMMVGAVAGLLAQWGLIRMFQMGPKALMTWGVALACIANVLTAFAGSFWMIAVGFGLASLGYGFARPGFTAGASLTVSMGEQAKAAGAIAIVNGLNVILAPGFVLLYKFVKPAPFVLNALILGGLLIYALKNRVLRSADDKLTGDDDDEATIALLERSDEGGV